MDNSLTASYDLIGNVKAERAPLVSALVCTRNRGESILDTIRSILNNDYPNFELVLIDQSTDNRSEQAIQQFLADQRLRYIRTSTRGIGLARDIGINEAHGDVVVVTDDDCEVPSDWITQFYQAFARHPEVAVAYCDVQPGPCDWEKGYIPFQTIKEDRLITKLRPRDGLGLGIGAGMALRRSVIRKIGGSDHLLGSPLFPAAEEVELGYRALLNGYAVYQLRYPSVVHHGFRTHQEYSKLLRGYMRGTAAMYAKLIKCGHWNMLVLFLVLCQYMVVNPIFVNLIRLRRPPVLGRVVGLAEGFIQGWRTPVNRATKVFCTTSVDA